MASYISFWKRGWWAWLFVLCANISFGVFLVPLAFAFHDNNVVYWVSAFAVWMVIGAPLWGWLFEYFATGSPRLISKETHGEIAGEFPT